MRLFTSLAVLALSLTALLPLPADARTRSHSGAHASSHGSQIRTASKHKASYSKASTAAERDKRGRIKRSTLASPLTEIDPPYAQKPDPPVTKAKWAVLAV